MAVYASWYSYQCFLDRRDDKSFPSQIVVGIISDPPVILIDHSLGGDKFSGLVYVFISIAVFCVFSGINPTDF